MKKKAAELWAHFKSGKTAMDVIRAGGYGKGTVFKYWRLWKKYQQVSQIIETILLESA